MVETLEIFFTVLQELILILFYILIEIRDIIVRVLSEKHYRAKNNKSYKNQY